MVCYRFKSSTRLRTFLKLKGKCGHKIEEAVWQKAVLISVLASLSRTGQIMLSWNYTVMSSHK